MSLPLLADLNLEHQKLLLRVDLDLDFSHIETDLRFTTLLPTLKYLLQQDPAQILLLGHRGRPQGKSDPALSLNPITSKLQSTLNLPVEFVTTITPPTGQVVLLENLRFHPQEEANDSEFAKQLAALGDIFINEAFSASHRSHASIVGLPQYLPHAAGLHFAKEVETLTQVLQHPHHPVVVIISGVKKDKLDYIKPFQKFADHILVAGKLPLYLTTSPGPQVKIATLTPSKLDITPDSIKTFKLIIQSAGTTILAGPPGKFEDKAHQQGTQEILQAIAASSAFKVVGGGDTQAAISQFKLENKFNWLSTGGGAMLEFLAHGTLPGIEALLV